MVFTNNNLRNGWVRLRTMETLSKYLAPGPSTRMAGEKSAARLEFARRLRDLRVPKGFRTARSLAKALGIDENRYTRYERAEVEPDLGLIRRICSVLRITPTDLLGTPEDLDDDAPAFDAAGDDVPPLPRAEPASRPRTETAVDLAAWKLACAVAEAKLGTNGSMGPGGATSMALIAAASPIYKRLRQSPFETIAELAGDHTLAGSPAPASARIAAAVNGLVGTLKTAV